MKKTASTICLILAILFGMGTIGLITTDPGTALFGALLTVGCFLLWRKLRTPRQSRSSQSTQRAPARGRSSQASQRRSSAPRSRYITIRVAGVTFANEDGSDRQRILRKIKFGDAPFEDNDNLDVQLESYSYRGEPAIRVLVEGHQIGNVPREQIAEVQRAMTQPGTQITAFEVVGGGEMDGERLSYGARITLRCGS